MQQYEAMTQGREGVETFGKAKSNIEGHTIRKSICQHDGRYGNRMCSRRRVVHGVLPIMTDVEM